MFLFSLSLMCRDCSSRDGAKADKVADDAKTKTGGTSQGKEKDLWISNLGSSTRATDLKQIFSKHGRVVGAKVCWRHKQLYFDLKPFA